MEPAEPLAPPSGPIPPTESVTASRSGSSQAELAARLNEQGRAAITAGDFDRAASKFREAVARVPEPKYFFNLCIALFQRGSYDEALTACNAVAPSGAIEPLLGKADDMIARIRYEAHRQNVPVKTP